MDIVPTGQSDRPGFSLFLTAYKVPLLLAMVSVSCIAIAIVLIVKSTQAATPIVISDNPGTADSEESLPFVVVDVSGAVHKPGVYELPYGSRVEDAITSAGGLTEEADREQIAKSINRAQKLSDGYKLYFFSAEDNTSHNGSNEGADALTSYNDFIQPIGGQEFGMVSINSSSQADLEGLSGIGPVTAQKIISNRPYASVDELKTKKVVGEKTFDKIKAFLTL